jgi:hypothetical protein
MKNIFKNTPIMDLVRRAKSLNQGRMFVEVMRNKLVQRYIVTLNTDQMRLDFMDSNGILLANIGGPYSPSTMATGKKHSPESIDLYDEGDFHNSFRIERITARPEGFDINSDSIKDDGTNLLVEWGKDIEGLTAESMDKLVELLQVHYTEKIRLHLGL